MIWFTLRIGGRKSETIIFSPSTPAEITTSSSSITLADSETPTPTPTSVPPLPKHDVDPPSIPPLPTMARNPSLSKSEGSLQSVPRIPPAPSSPTRVRSMNDVLSRLGESARAYDSDGGRRLATKSSFRTMKGVSKSDEALPSSVGPSQTETVEPQDVPIIPRIIKP